MFEKIKNIFKKNEEERLETGNYAIIRVNSIAKEKGITDNENKEVVILENNKVKEVIPYFEGFENILREVGQIPVVNEEISEEQQFHFIESASFGHISRRRFL